MDTYIDQVKSLLETKTVEKEEPETVVKAEEISDYDHLLLLADAKRTEDIKYWLAEKNNLDYLMRFVQKNHDLCKKSFWHSSVCGHYCRSLRRRPVPSA